MLKRSVALKTIITSAVFGIRLLVQAGTLVVVAKMLGPKDFGMFSGLAALSVLVGALSCFGLNVMYLDEVSKDARKRTYFLSYAIPTTLVFSLCLLCVYVVLADYLVSGGSWQLVLFLGVAEVVVQPLLALLVGEFVAFGRPALAQLFLVFPLALRLISAIAILGYKPLDPLLYYGLACLVASLFSILLLGIVLAGSLPRAGSWRVVKGYELRQSAGYAAVSVSSLGPTELDKAIAVKLLPSVESGIYAATSRVVGASTLPVIALMLSVLPRLFRLDSEEIVVAKRFIWWVLGLTLTYGIFLALCLFCATPLLPKLFGEAFVGVESAIQLMCLAIPALTVRLASGNILIAGNKAWQRFSLEVAGIVALVLVAILIASSLGLRGLIFAVVVAEWLMAVIGVGCVCHLVRKERVFKVSCQ